MPKRKMITVSENVATGAVQVKIPIKCRTGEQEFMHLFFKATDSGWGRCSLGEATEYVPFGSKENPNKWEELYSMEEER